VTTSITTFLFRENRENCISKHGDAAWVGKVNDLLLKLSDPVIDGQASVTNPSANSSKSN
jgi:hypothetical protein